jgi:hypothetical protein
MPEVLGVKQVPNLPSAKFKASEEGNGRGKEGQVGEE